MIYEYIIFSKIEYIKIIFVFYKIMKILSFDIGIKNMALCCLEVNTENKRIDILHWDILNLVNDNSFLIVFERF